MCEAYSSIWMLTERISLSKKFRECVFRKQVHLGGVSALSLGRRGRGIMWVEGGFGHHKPRKQNLLGPALLTKKREKVSHPIRKGWPMIETSLLIWLSGRFKGTRLVLGVQREETMDWYWANSCPCSTMNCAITLSMYMESNTRSNTRS